MAKKHTQRRRRHSLRSRRNQRGGSPNYGYGGEIIRTGSGAPLEAWSHSDPHCDSASSLRPAPMLGGRRRKSQRGGGCGCMGTQRGGSSGNGGFSLVLNNENGKMFDGIVRGACPAPQVGGDPKQLIQSYPSGYGLVNPYNSNNANFLEYESYGRQCMGGGKRRSRRKNNRRSKNRRHH